MFDFFNKDKNTNNIETKMFQLSSENEGSAPISDVNNRVDVDVKESDFIDKTDPNGKANHKIVTINYGTNMPIDSIFAYIEEDWEEQGRRDASANPDANYMLTKISIIRDTLKRRFELVRLRYKKDIRNYTAQIENLQTLGLTGSQVQINAYIETCKEHLEKLDSMEKKLDNNDPSMTTMMDSYKRGFSLGVSVEVQSKLND